MGAPKRLQTIYRSSEIKVEVAELGRHCPDLMVVTKPAKLAGMIVVLQWEEMAKLVPPGINWRKFRWGPEHIRYELLTGVYHALRQTYHILFKHGYDFETGEKAAMTRAIAASRRLHLAILGADRVSLGTLQENVEDLVEDLLTTIGRPRSLSKKLAVQKLRELKTGVDSLGRINPSAAAAKALNVHAVLEWRLKNELLVMDPRIISRQQQLLSVIHLTEFHLKSTGDFLAELLQRGGLSSLYNSARRQAVSTHLLYCLNGLKALNYNPYRIACTETISDMAEAQVLLADDGFGHAMIKRIRRILEPCQAAIGILAELVEIERIIFRLTQADYRQVKKFPYRSTRNKLMAIDRQLFKLTRVKLRHNPLPVIRPFLKPAITLLELERPDRLSEVRTCLKEVSAGLSGFSVSDELVTQSD